MTDSFGEALAAAFGPVPESAGPMQQARDGEDFAIAMLAEVALGEVEVYTDCSGTVSAANNQAAATTSRNPRAHLWNKYHVGFDGQGTVTKTLAHASAKAVSEGKTTAWERKGNDAADVFAKKGGQMSPNAPGGDPGHSGRE